MTAGGGVGRINANKEQDARQHSSSFSFVSHDRSSATYYYAPHHCVTRIGQQREAGSSVEAAADCLQVSEVGWSLRGASWEETEPTRPPPAAPWRAPRRTALLGGSAPFHLRRASPPAPFEGGDSFGRARVTGALPAAHPTPVEPSAAPSGRCGLPHHRSLARPSRNGFRTCPAEHGPAA